MQPVFFTTPIAVILLLLLIGFVIGVGITVLLYRTQRPVEHNSSDSAVTQRDPSNPYEPSTVGLRASNGTTGCAIVFAVLFIVAITLIAFAATFFFAATSVVKSVPAPVPPPPTVVQPQDAPALEPEPKSN